MATTKLLLLAPDPGALAGALRREGIEVIPATALDEAIPLLERDGGIRLVLAAESVAGGALPDLVRRVRAARPSADIVVLAGRPSVEAAVATIRAGAFDYLTPPFSCEKILGCLGSIEAGRREASPAGEGGPEGLVGSHPSIVDLRGAIENVAHLRTTVLILGESGTGKELVARAIHRRGPEPSEPFIAINCAAFARNLLEDQLFGHVRGAFTGALGDKDGFFVAAGRGTLFLDEITELEADLQGRLLRAIQEREVVPLGTNDPVPWRARLIVATNRDIERLCEEGKFRKDLYYRINVVQFRTPSLRERPEDIPALAEHFLGRLERQGGIRKVLSPEALELLVRYSYPGNVRELRNAIERAHALGPGTTIRPEDLPRGIRGAPPEGFKPLAEMERDHILRALRMAGGRKVLAARILEIDRNRLNRKMRRLGIGGDGQVPGDPARPGSSTGIGT